MELEELLQLSTKNDRKAHYLLFKKVFPIIYWVCKRYYSNDQDIKSSVNMIFLKIFILSDLNQIYVKFIHILI